MISQRASQISLSLLLLSGPLLAFSVRGFAAMMALAGIAAAVSLMPRSKEILAELRPEKLKPFALPLAALAYILVSSNWSISDRGGDTAVRLILVIGFAAACIKMFAGLPEAQKPNWARRLAVSLSAGIGLSLLIGPYNVYWPELVLVFKDQFELLRQVNSALSIMPVFLFLLAAAFSRTHFRLACGALAVAFVVTAVSESQTSLLSMLLGVTAFGLAKLSVKLCRNLVFGALLVSTLAAPHIFVSSQENGWVESYAPAVVKNKGAGEIRQWIYFVYGKEALERPLFGHGLNGTKFFAPHQLAHYTSEQFVTKRTKKHISRAKRDGTVAAHAHNLFLQIVFEFGYVGALLILAAVWVWLQNTVMHISNVSAPFVWGAIGASLGTLMFGFTLWHSWLMAVFACAAATATILPYADGKKT